MNSSPKKLSTTMLAVVSILALIGESLLLRYRYSIFIN